MRLAVVSQEPEGPVVRHRVRAVEPCLRAAGFEEVSVRAIPRRVRDRFALWAWLADADLVLLQRRLSTGAELLGVRRAARRLAYDLDDALMFRDPVRGRPVSLVRRRRFRRIARAADLVAAGNEYLLALVREDAPATDAVLAPTPIDTDRYRPGGPAPRGFRAGWIGSRATRQYLAVVAPALARVAAGREDLVVAVMADAPPRELAGLPVEFTPWSEEAEVPFLRSLHVGLAPLTDDAFSRGKCGLKLLQYMACGVPAIASPVGVHPVMCDGGRTAVLAATEDAWVEALLALAEDPARAKTLAEAARAAVEERWSVRTLGPAFAAALARCARG